MLKPKISIAEFISRLPSAKIECDFNQEGSMIYDDSPYAPRELLWGFIYNRLTLPGMSICYVYAYDYPQGKPSKIDLEEAQDTWQIEHADFEVVTEDGDILSPNQIGEIIINNKCEIIEIDCSILGEDEIMILDSTAAEEQFPSLKTYTVCRDNDSDIRFRGKIIGSADSRSDYGRGSRWEELVLYQTAGGKYVCLKIGHTRWQGETTRYTAEVCDIIDEVVKFFGFKSVAKELYSDAGIETATLID